MSPRTLTVDCGQPFTQEVAGFVADLAARAGLSPRQAYGLRLAAEEITTNIAQHGYGGPGPLLLASEVEADRAWVTIEDEAPAFDPNDHDPSPHLATDLAERAEGGYGLLLALRRLDEFVYERAGSTNRNTLIMKLDAGGTENGGADHGHDARPARR